MSAFDSGGIEECKAIAAELEGLPPEARGTLGGPMERVTSAVAFESRVSQLCTAVIVAGRES